MSAVVKIERWTGPSNNKVKTDITSINTVANAVDLHQVTASTSVSPVRIPTGVIPNRSFWVNTTLNITTAPSGYITNIKWYSDGTNNFGTGISCSVGWLPVYYRALGTVGVTGNELETDSIWGLTIQANGWDDVTQYTSGSPLAVDSTKYTTTGPIQKFVVYQMSVNNTTTLGVSSQETFTWIIDET